LDAVEREPVKTRVLNPTASEASYKPEQLSYRKTNLKKKVLVPDSPGAETYPTPKFKFSHQMQIFYVTSQHDPV